MGEISEVSEVSDVLFVKSKVRQYIKRKGLNTAGEILDGEVLNDAFKDLLSKACNRAHLEKKKTLLLRHI